MLQARFSKLNFVSPGRFPPASGRGNETASSSAVLTPEDWDDDSSEPSGRIDKAVAVWRLEDCTLARMAPLPRAWYSDFPTVHTGESVPRSFSPALVFCGAEYLVCAGIVSWGIGSQSCFP